MNENTIRLIYWTPRLLAIAFAIFLSIFALDVFSESGTPLHKAGALLIHMIPSGLVLLALLLAWRREWIGALVFPLLAVVLFTRSGQLHWSAYALIEGPLILLGILFWIAWKKRPAVALQ